LSSDLDDSNSTISLTVPFQEGGVNIATVASPNTLTIRVGSEIMTVTAYTAGDTSATVARGAEDSEAVEHFAGDPVKHVITKKDFFGASALSGWFQDNVAATQTAVALAMGNTHTEAPMPMAGYVVGIAVYSNAARTTGTLTVDATINGTVTGLTAVLDGTNTQTHSTRQALTSDAFTAGQRIGVKITTSGTWAPTTADIDVVVLVAFDLYG
jgi:hypothetical protein